MKRLTFACLFVFGLCFNAFAANEEISVTSATAVGFTDVTIRESKTCVIRNGAYDVMVDWTGGTPTASTGMIIKAYDVIYVDPYQYNRFLAIAVSTTSTMYGMCD